jgi:hypothetical protein|tara:strand:- start:326 stop:568 length:243 start_codon:yes stop_codon:yes gene_type:complete
MVRSKTALGPIFPDKKQSRRIDLIQVSRRVNLRELKEFVLTNLPKKSLLRDLILSEKEDVTANEFVVKLDMWLKLLRRES